MSGISESGAGLDQIQHIVVLMQENRSFDHMLGYLKRDGMPELEGLTGEELNYDSARNPYPVFAYPDDETAFHKPGQPLDKSLDPCHSPDCVAVQLSEHHGGFVKNFIDKKNPPADKRGLVMGHYTAHHLPVYDFLARTYCVCDAWHASIPGDTWPNRLYALAGREGPPVLPKLSWLRQLLGLVTGSSKIWNELKGAPIFEVEAFTRQLAEAQWRWYSHDPATLRGADKQYRRFPDLDRDNFAYFDRKKMSFLTESVEYLLVDGSGFLDDVAQGKLRQVSWIDPNFIDVSLLDPNSNDDHPPSDVLAGQALVLDIYDALTKSPGWNDTLFIIVYDEHGGFFDHVTPPPVADDGSGYTTYGVRVPALIIGPRVKDSVCKQLFDHTSLIKTILQRFAPNASQAIARMGPRVANAADLGVVLTNQPRDNIPDHSYLHARLNDWRARARAERLPTSSPSAAPDGSGHPLELTELQEDFAKFSVAMHRLGLPAGHP